MERDLDVMPGLKLAGCAVLVIAVVGSLAYPVSYSVFGYVNRLNRNGPIDFFGKVVDPQGNPLTGVTLSAKVRYYSIFGGNSEKTVEHETDHNGRFRIKFRSGTSVRVEDFTKPGYSIRGLPASKGEGGGTLGHWLFYFTPTDRNQDLTSQDHPFTFVMDPSSGP